MKRILLIATGGTIASAEDGRGLSPALSGAELAACVPEINDLCHLEVLQLMNIDSTNMRPADWLRICRAIAENYAAYDGFLILHGTDTMAYTAAALSYLIPQSEKPIVITGSQQPMTSSFTDAKLNIYQSLLYTLDRHARDVCIVFGGIVIAGTRARKQRTMSSNAFTSVNYPPLAYIRNDRIVRAGALMHAPGALDQRGCETPAGGESVAEDGAAKADAAETKATKIDVTGNRMAEQAVAGSDAGKEHAPAAEAPTWYRIINDRVAVLKLTPGLNPGLFEALTPAYDALILEIYGLGGIPDYGEGAPSFKRAIFDWVASGRSIVLTTQVPEEGLDLGIYEVGRAYAEHPGILRGGDMTTEAIVAKMMWALGQTRDPRELERLFYRPVNHDRAPDYTG